MFSIYKFTIISLPITIILPYIQFSSNQYFLKAVAYARFMLNSSISFTYFNIINKLISMVTRRDV